MKKQCLVCKKTFNADYSKKKYCSRECYEKVIWTNNQVGNKNKQWREITTKEELIDLYTKQKRSIVSISKLKDCSETLIRKRLRLYNIKKRNYEEQIKVDTELGRMKERTKHLIVDGSKKRNRKNYLKIAKEHLEWKCDMCGKPNTNDNFDLVVHHKDKNNKNNELSNLHILCQSCHSKLHTQMRYKKIICTFCGKEFYGFESRRYCSKRCFKDKFNQVRRDKDEIDRNK